MEDFEERDSQNVTRQWRNFKKLSDITGEERIEYIKKLLRLDNLNQDEYEQVKRLIINSADRF